MHFVEYFFRKPFCRKLYLSNISIEIFFSETILSKKKFFEIRIFRQIHFAKVVLRQKMHVDKDVLNKKLFSIILAAIFSIPQPFCLLIKTENYTYQILQETD